MILAPALTMALATGLVGSAHCAAMCGPLVVAGCPRAPAGAAYFTGRLAAYATMGAVMGHLGRHALCILPMSALEGMATALVAAAAAYRGLTLLRPAPAEAPLVALGKKARRGSLFTLLGQLLPRSGLGLGLVTGVLPCGLLLPAWALAAGTASAPTGALVMTVFALATLPGLLVPLLGRRLLRRATARLPAAATGAAWCALAAWMLVRLALVSTGKCH